MNQSGWILFVTVNRSRESKDLCEFTRVRVIVQFDGGEVKDKEATINKKQQMCLHQLGRVIVEYKELKTRTVCDRPGPSSPEHINTGVH